MPTYKQSRKIEAVSKIYQRGKTQVPSEVRKSLGAKDGDKLVWIMQEGHWVIELA